MKRKINRRIFLAVLICFSIMSHFKSYKAEPGDIEGITLSTLAYASGEEGEEVSIPDDPIIDPLGFWEWLQAVTDSIGF